ncbi:MAG: hypothetical protein ACI9CV_000498 [Ilumatobacter sp.]|jgi:hypothetical protein
MEAVGAVPQVEPPKAFRGGYSSDIAAPDGHLWEIFDNPSASFNDHGQFVVAPPAASTSDVDGVDARRRSREHLVLLGIAELCSDLLEPVVQDRE